MRLIENARWKSSWKGRPRERQMDGWIDGWTDLEGLPTDREKKVAEEETCGEMLGEGRKLQSGQIIE